MDRKIGRIGLNENQIRSKKGRRIATFERNTSEVYDTWNFVGEIGVSSGTDFIPEVTAITSKVLESQYRVN
jgi:hypothetical protein